MDGPPGLLRDVVSDEPRIAAIQTVMVAMKWATEYAIAESRGGMKKLLEIVQVEIAVQASQQQNMTHSDEKTECS